MTHVDLIEKLLKYVLLLLPGKSLVLTARTDTTTPSASSSVFARALKYPRQESGVDGIKIRRV